MATPHSATELMQLWADGEESAAESIYRRYAQQLCTLANSHLGSRIQQRVGADDIVQSVFRTFFARAKSGQYAIDHSGALWKLLVTITLNKVKRQVEFHSAGMRRVDSEVDQSACSASTESMLPEAVALQDELEHLVSQLHDPEPRILELRLAGYSTDEIAGQLGITRWTVRRTLNRIGLLLQQRFGANS